MWSRNKMKTTIWKYILGPDETIQMPKGAVILTAQEQYGEVAVWACVDPTETELTPRRFVTPGTGHDIAEGSLQYISTVQLGSLVFHIFEVLS
jgi:hypothetical protein